MFFMKKKRIFWMPGGKRFTTDPIKYCRAWERPAKRLIRRVTGLQLIGFDPGYLFRYGNTSFSLPTELVVALSKL